jgi:pimeloyl-ACP methyl ester carboxylesterase
LAHASVGLSRRQPSPLGGVAVRADAAGFERMTAPLLVRDHHVLPRVAGLGHAVAPDFFGFGDSEAIRGDPVETAGEESLAGGLELVDSLALGRVIMVGQDIGSAVAPALARAGTGARPRPRAAEPDSPVYRERRRKR